MKKEISLDESKKIQLDILRSIDSFCRKNSIHYSLGAGSAIGAVRHKGFIPWDDDIDLLMWRADYEFFLSNYIDSKYKLLHYKTSSTWDSYFACVEEPRTITFWGDRKKSTRGIWVSIFPIDYIPDDDDALDNYITRVQRVTLKNQILRLKNSYWTKNTSFIYNTAKWICRTVLKMVPYKVFFNKVDKIVDEFKNKPSKRLASVAGWTFDTIFDYPVEVFSDYLDVDFEDMKCMLCKGYDEYLRKQYGDYMVLPPIEEQVPKHEATIYWKD